MSLNSISSLEAPCTGCGACIAVCPVNAISIKKSEYGNYQAYVNEDVCVHCGKCCTVCVRSQYKKCTDIRNGVLYAMQSNNPEIVRQCTSGGIASELAQWGYQHGMTVAGTAYDYEENIAKMIIVRTEEDLQKLRGSKYIQSYSGNSVRDIFKLAESKPTSKFMVFGTPCQIYGIHQIAVKKGIRDRMLLVDLFCHGVPYGMVWDMYLRDVENRSNTHKWQSICFRDSRISWHNFTMTMENSNLEWHENCERSIFYRAFFDNVLLSKQCFNCKSRCIGSGADLRLGDFWGKRFAKRDDGVSAVLCLTEYGERVLEKVSSNIKNLGQFSVSECFSTQSVDPYGNTELSLKAIQRLYDTKNLKKTISWYRSKLPIKYQIKCQVKNIIGYFPNCIRNRIKLFARK